MNGLIGFLKVKFSCNLIAGVLRTADFIAEEPRKRKIHIFCLDQGLLEYDFGRRLNKTTKQMFFLDLYH